MSKALGSPKTGGRKAGTPNKTTAAVKNCIASVIADYTTPQDGGSPLQRDLAEMQPADRVRAITQLAGYIIPKQQAVSIGEQTRAETEALTEWLQSAPAEAVDAIAAKVMALNAANKAQTAN